DARRKTAISSVKSAFPRKRVVWRFGANLAPKAVLPTTKVSDIAQWQREIVADAGGHLAVMEQNGRTALAAEFPFTKSALFDRADGRRSRASSPAGRAAKNIRAAQVLAKSGGANARKH